MTNPTDASREAFEKWYVEVFDGGLGIDKELELWKCWQAALSTQQPMPLSEDEAKLSEAFPHCYIGKRTFAEWQEHAKADNCFEDMVPSDLRSILDFGKKMQACARYWCDELAEDKRESNKLRALLAATSIKPATLSEDEAVDIMGSAYMQSGEDNGCYSRRAMLKAYRALVGATRIKPTSDKGERDGTARKD